MYMLGRTMAQRYLLPSDLIIGIVGGEGAGKSTLIKALFPGLELTNDDNGVNMPEARIYKFEPEDYFAPHTFHLDIRYELAFHQPFEIVEAVNKVIGDGRRVIMEHFDLIYDHLGFNAQLLFAIGEELIVTRPTMFGPFPTALKKYCEKTSKYRIMAHSAEDITSLLLNTDYGYKRQVLHSDVKHGFVIKFEDKPDIKIKDLEQKVKEIIKKDVPIGQSGYDKISIGTAEMHCTGPRTHVKSSGQIENFRLLDNFVYDPVWDEYLLVGMVGEEVPDSFPSIDYVFGNE